MIVVAVARKPLAEGTVAANILAVHTGALHIDSARVGTHKNTTPSGMDRYNARLQEQGYRPGAYAQGTPEPPAVVGRWPTNLVLQHLDNCKMVGLKRVWANQSSSPGSGVGHENTPNKGIFQAGLGGKVKSSTADADGMETVEDWTCALGCPVADLDQVGVARFFKQVGGIREGGT